MTSTTRCPSHLFHPSQKPWNFASPPDTLSGMHKIIEIFADRAALHTEILALRQQVAVLKRKRPRPLLRKADRVFWVILSCLWPGWRHALVIVRPETVIGWHRKGFRLFWTWKSRRGKPGRPPVSREIRYLVRRMSRKNTRWGAPRIHGELLKLGFSISQAAVSKYMVRYPSPPSQSWRTLPYKSRRLPGVDRFLRGPHGHVPPPVRVHRAPPRAPPDRAFRCHGEPDDGVGRTADPRGIPVGHGAAVPDPRPGRRIRAIVPLDRDGDGRGRGRHGATEPVAKSVCGTPDRQREARMPGPFDHPQRAAFAAHSWLIPRLLLRFKDPPVDRQGHTGWSTRSAGRVRSGRFLAQGRRSASSLRTPRGLTTPARIRSIPLCGDVDAAGIRMPLHRFAGTIRRNKHRDDRAHGRLQNPLAQNDVRAGEPSRRWEARWNKWKGQPSPATGLPRLPVSPSLRAVPTAPADRNGCIRRLLPRSTRPSPNLRRVGVHIFTFEACSGFTRVRPARALNRPRRPLSQGFGPAGYPTRPPVSYQIKPTTVWVDPSANGVTRRRGALRSPGQNAS